MGRGEAGEGSSTLQRLLPSTPRPPPTVRRGGGSCGRSDTAELDKSEDTEAQEIRGYFKSAKSRHFYTNTGSRVIIDRGRIRKAGITSGVEKGGLMVWGRGGGGVLSGETEAGRGK